MKRSGKIAVVVMVILTLVLAFTAFTGCSEFMSTLFGVQDGKDGDGFDLHTFYEEQVAAGEFEGTYDEFLKELLGVQAGETDEQNYVKAVNTALRSAVSINVINNFTNSLESAGAGVIYSVDKTTGNALIVTSYSVVSGYSGSSYTRSCYLFGQEYSDFAIPFTIKGESSTYGIAVLQVTGSEVIKNSQSVAVTLGSSATMQVGDTAFVTGNSLGQGVSVASGIVSMLHETPSGAGNLDTFRVDAVVNAGDWGGGVYDKDGKLLGLLYSYQEEGNGVANVLRIDDVKAKIVEIANRLF